MAQQPRHGRVLWRNIANHAECLVQWSVVTKRSYVVVTAAEAAVPEEPALVMPVDRFIGEARQMIATNIAPFDGGVRFCVQWWAHSGEGGLFPNLDVWTDITVFDPADPVTWEVAFGVEVELPAERPDS
jgi:hypothetical protein